MSDLGDPTINCGDRGSTVVKVLCYKSEDCFTFTFTSSCANPGIDLASLEQEIHPAGLK